MAVVLFFVAHWALAIFVQTFFLHRYAAHKMFTMSRGWERFFHLATFIVQGSSYLDPRGYAIMHRMHHAYSDTVKDPHSPHNYRGWWALPRMAWGMKYEYEAVAYGGEAPEARFDGDAPSWPTLDRLGQGWPYRLLWGVAIFFAYVALATSWWQFLLLPIHWLMGPIHGTIVNWCGHRYGYRNHATTDQSRNTLPFDFLCGGELFQNNHHRHSRRPNFANRPWELDPTYQVMRVLALLRIIRFPEQASRARKVADDCRPARAA